MSELQGVSTLPRGESPPALLIPHLAGVNTIERYKMLVPNALMDTSSELMVITWEPAEMKYNLDGFKIRTFNHFLKIPADHRPRSQEVAPVD